MSKRAVSGLLLMAMGLAAFAARASSDDPRQLVSKLDIDFQAAVKINDVKTMERILHKDMILVLGNGTAQTRDELMKEARDKSIVYEQQDEDPGTQTVRVWVQHGRRHGEALGERSQQRPRLQSKIVVQ